MSTNYTLNQCPKCDEQSDDYHWATCPYVLKHQRLKDDVVAAAKAWRIGQATRNPVLAAIDTLIIFEQGGE